jgi:hypothetical protein
MPEISLLTTMISLNKMLCISNIYKNFASLTVNNVLKTPEEMFTITHIGYQS